MKWGLEHQARGVYITESSAGLKRQALLAVLPRTRIFLTEAGKVKWSPGL